MGLKRSMAFPPYCGGCCVLACTYWVLACGRLARSRWAGSRWGQTAQQVGHGVQVLAGCFPIAQLREPFSAVRLLAERSWPRLHVQVIISRF